MERIGQKIGRINEYLTLVRSMQENCFERFTSDAIYRGALLHYLYLLSDSCIALAELMIKYKNCRPPQSYHEAFEILGDNGILDSSFAYDFAKIAGFRNFLAHDYEQIDAQTVCSEILNKLGDVERFLEQVKKTLE